jgi:hypothetical protein
LKERFKKLGDERVMINNLFAPSDGEGEESDEEFYKNEDEPSGKIPGSVPGKPTFTGASMLRTQTLESNYGLN